MAAVTAAANSASVVSDSVRPHRWQPTRPHRPWDSPGKNTGVGCHFLLQCMKVKSESKVTQLCPTLSDPMDRSLPGSSIYGIFQARVLEWVAIAEWLSSKNLQIINDRRGMEKREVSYNVGGSVTWCSHYGKQYGSFLKS